MNNITENILIVEDEIISSEYLKQILHSLGYTNIFEAANAKKALEIASTVTLDLVFLDINIDGSIDGIQCARMLNNKYTIPVIYTTAYRSSEIIKEVRDTNIYGFLVKPFEVYNVEAALAVFLNINVKNNDLQNDNKTIIALGNSQYFNMQANTFSINNVVINLTRKEILALSIFCENLNQNISYEVLKEHIWENQSVSLSTIRDTILRLRKKAPKLNIQSVSGFGYILVNQE